MPRKLSIILTTLLASTAFMLVPLAAQATSPHYYVNGAKLKEGVASTKTSIGWGTLMSGCKGCSPGGHFTCHYARAGTLLNPAGGGAGEGLTQVFASFQCEQEFICPSGTTASKVTADNLPWHNVLSEKAVGVIRQETTEVRIVVECFEGGALTASIPWINDGGEGWRPKVQPGSSALHPGFLEFDEGSGELEVEGSAGTITGTFPGTMRTLGYNAQELIGVANP